MFSDSFKVCQREFQLNFQFIFLSFEQRLAVGNVPFLVKYFQKQLQFNFPPNKVIFSIFW